MIPRLCFITDANAPLSIPEQALAAAKGGAGWVQLRHKTLPDAEFAALAERLMAQLAPLGVPLIINDRVDVACRVGAPGVHIGQSDGDPQEIRQRIGADRILGLSIEDPAQVSHTPPNCIDYFGVGPVRATGSKTDHAPPMEFDGLRRAVSQTTLPCMAIGGLTAKDMPAVNAAGCHGVAIVSAISRAVDPETAARAFVTGDTS